MRIREHSPNVYVITAEDVESVRQFFEGFGLVFNNEKHGSCKPHLSCERQGRVLEIYYPEARPASPPVQFSPTGAS